MRNATEIRAVVVANDSSELVEAASVTPDSQLPREITPESLAVLQVAANEFFAKPVRIVSVKILPVSSMDSDAWLQRGRDTIQALHNLVQQRH